MSMPIQQASPGSSPTVYGCEVPYGHAGWADLSAAMDGLAWFDFVQLYGRA